MVLLAFAAVSACRESPQAPINHPKPGPEWIRITMDDGVTDYPSWGGLDLLALADTEFDFVTVETEYGTLQYGGCAQNCQDPGRWMVGAVDSGSYRGLGPNASSVRTPGGIAVAYEDVQAGPFRIKIGTCGGACYRKAGWQFGDIRTGTLGSIYGTHSRVLASDPAGGLDLLYRGPPNGVDVVYAHCSSGCTDSASWQSVVLDSGLAFYPYDDALTVGPSGSPHALVQAGGVLTYFECDSGCTSRTNWNSLVLASRNAGATPSILVGPSGTVYVTFRDSVVATGTPVEFATCSGQCLTMGNWSVTSLPVTAGNDIAILLDGAEHPWVATTYGTYSYLDGKTVVLHCSGGCNNVASWSTMTIDSLGDGLDVSMVLDGTGQPRIVVSGFGVHYVQRPDTTVLIH